MTFLIFLIGITGFILVFRKITHLEDDFKVKVAFLEAKLKQLESLVLGEKPKKASVEKVKERPEEEKPEVKPTPKQEPVKIFEEKKIELPVPVPPKPREPLFDEAPVVAKPEPIVSRPPQKTELEKKWENFVETVDWEQFTGVKLFAWLGGIALFCGAAFFVKYSIDRNLIPPALRIAVGAILGVGLLIWSLRIDRKKYETTSHILAAGGVGVLYTVVYSASHIFHFLPNFAGLVLLAVVSASSFVLAIYLEGISISTLGALGAYAAPILLSTGESNLPALFVYLSIVNAGIFEVVRRLKSAGLFLLSVLGTLFLLFLGTWGAHVQPEPWIITSVALGNLALFCFFLFRMPSEISKSGPVKGGGFTLFLGLAGLAFILMGEPGFYPLVLVTAGMTMAVCLGYQREVWAGAVIPYNILTFIVALLWVVARFNAKEISMDFLLFLVYGIVGGLGPLVLVRKYGLKDISLHWFRIFPVAAVFITLFILFKSPETSFWFWPMLLGLHLAGMFIGFLIGGLLELCALMGITLLAGLLWITRSPHLVLDLGFYGFFLLAGILLCGAAVFFFKALPGWLSAPGMKPFQAKFNQMDQIAAEWMAAFPALGAFLLLGTSFLVQNPIQPDAGMATGLCFLAITLFMGRRISSAPLVMTSLAAFVLAQSCWMMRDFPDKSLNTEVLYWSGILWLGSLLVPFIFFGPAEKQKQTWQAWALFELVQGFYFLRGADCLWPRDIMGWFPLALFILKVPAVKSLLTSLEGKAERNGILAFHGGVLLFYLSCMPILLLDNGWLGLTLVFESMALLWLNRRIEHPGLPWVATFMAPTGLVFLMANLHQLRPMGSEPIFNWAIGAVALAVAALGFAAKLAPENTTKNTPVPYPAYFLWLAVGTGFYLLNLMVADWFGGPGTGIAFQIFSEPTLIQFICYNLLWALFGAVLWRVSSLPQSLRFVGLLLLAAGWLRILIMPYLYHGVMVGLHPLLNLTMVAYLPLLVILFFLIIKQEEEKVWGDMKPFFIGMLAVLGLAALHLEGGTFLQPEDPISLIFRHNASMALASAVGWVVYGLAMYLWPRMLEKPFRIAGVGLATLGFLKMMVFPFRFPEMFGSLTPILNLPNLVFLAFIGVQLYLLVKDQEGRWPSEILPDRWYWGPVMGIFSFFVLNVEVVQIFGLQGQPFTFDSGGRFSQQLAYSLSWLVFAMILLWVGIKGSSVGVRWTALCLFFVTTLKIFFMDLWSLGQLYRVASFIGLAVVLILVSFLYQRFLSSGRKK